MTLSIRPKFFRWATAAAFCFSFTAALLAAEARIAFDVFLHRFEHAVTLARILEHYYPDRKGVMHRQMSRFPNSPKPRHSIWDLV